MTLDGGDIVWAFDGRDGRSEGLESLLGLYAAHLAELLPDEGGEPDDPFERIVADLSDDPTERMLSDPRLARLFPPALGAGAESDEFWRNSIHAQTRGRIGDVATVSDALEAWDGFVPVTLSEVDAWAKALGALRVFWHAELAGTDRLANPSPRTIAENPALADLIDWLGYLQEDLMESRAACVGADASLDPDQFTRVV